MGSGTARKDIPANASHYTDPSLPSSPAAPFASRHLAQARPLRPCFLPRSFEYVEFLYKNSYTNVIFKIPKLRSHIIAVQPSKAPWMGPASAQEPPTRGWFLFCYGGTQALGGPPHPIPVAPNGPRVIQPHPPFNKAREGGGRPLSGATELASPERGTPPGASSKGRPGPLVVCRLGALC